MVAPFPWSALSRVDRRTGRYAGWLGARLGVGGGVDLGVDALVVERAEVLTGDALADRLADPTAGVCRVRQGGVRGFVIVPGFVIRAIARGILGGPEELGAPRPLTRAESAVLVAAVAAVVDGQVEEAHVGSPEVPGLVFGAGVVVDLRLAGRIVGNATLVLPMSVEVTPTRLAPRLDAPWLDAEVDLAVVVASAHVGRAQLGGLRVRDVLTVRTVGRRGEVDLPVARGRLRGALATGSGRVTVLAPYERRTMDETLAEDQSLDVSVAIGDVRMSMRSLLELRPGQVLELGKPVGTGVELRLGARVVARGELVDVDGEVGVRVLSLDRPL